jgi:thiol:disulfide interchange protein DsbD
MRRFLLLLLAALVLAPAAHALTEKDLLDPDKAFRLSVRAVDDRTLEVRYAIADGYYMYREKFAFEPKTPGATVGAPGFPPGTPKQDEFFGRVETYRGDIAIRVPVAGAGDKLSLDITSQGCADVGVCYPPETRTVRVAMAAGAAGTVDAAGGLFAQGPGSASSSRGAAPDFGGRPVRGEPQAVNDEGRFEQLLASGSFWLIVAGFFGAGLLLTFTPCVLPMIPILSGIIVGEGRHITRGRAFALSVAYVLGMAVTYTAIGVAAALSGSLLSAALQNPWVLGAFALVFVALAMSMFGFYDLQLPSALQSQLHSANSRLKGGQYGAVAVMGVLSAAIVSPCIAAPLAGALLYISQTRDVMLGGFALFAMALGMGVPLIGVGTAGGAFLPKSGHWMKSVKHFFGVLLLGVAIWIVSPVVPDLAVMLAWAALLVISAMYLHALDPLPHEASGFVRFWKGVGVLSLVAGVALVLGALAGSRDPLQPLAGFRLASAEAGGPAGAAGTAGEVRFERVRSVAELDARLKTAAAPVMLDFYADWCVSCKEMERFTFTDPVVRARLDGMVLLQADVTANNADDKALLKRFRLFGPPGIVFFDAQGREIPGIRVIGYQPADKFAKTLDQVR